MNNSRCKEMTFAVLFSVFRGRAHNDKLNTALDIEKHTGKKFKIKITS